MLRHDGAALLQHRDDIPTITDPGLWVFPGGHLDDDESPRDGAAREMEEETCYRCRDLRPLTRLPLDEEELQFFWENYNGQPVACREGQALKFVHRQEIESLPRQPYLTAVFDLALAAQKQTGVPHERPNQTLINGR